MEGALFAHSPMSASIVIHHQDNNKNNIIHFGVMQACLGKHASKAQHIVTYRSLF